MPSLVHSRTTSLRETLSTFSPLSVFSRLFKSHDTTMDLNPWVLLVERTFSQSTAHTLRLYISAAEKLEDSSAVLDRLDVVWIWYNKLEEAPQHEYFVIETADRMENNLIRRFLLERTVTRNEATQDTEAENAEAESPSTLAEPSPSYPHVSSPELSISDSATLAATKVAHATSESLDKLDKREASDRFLGEFYVDNPRYASGCKRATAIRPSPAVTVRVTRK